MIANHASRAAFICAAVVLAGWVLAAEAQTSANSKAEKSEAGAMHKLAIQVNQSDKSVMDLALNNAKNVIDSYRAKGETVGIEIATYGPGLHMLRADTSPEGPHRIDFAREFKPCMHRLRQYPGQPEQGRG